MSINPHQEKAMNPVRMHLDVTRHTQALRRREATRWRLVHRRKRMVR